MQVFARHRFPTIEPQARRVCIAAPRGFEDRGQRNAAAIERLVVAEDGGAGGDVFVFDAELQIRDELLRPLRGRQRLREQGECGDAKTHRVAPEDATEMRAVGCSDRNPRQQSRENRDDADRLHHESAEEQRHTEREARQ